MKLIEDGETGPQQRKPLVDSLLQLVSTLRSSKDLKIKINYIKERRK